MIAQANKYVFKKMHQSLPLLSFRQTCPDTRSPSVCARDALQNWARNDPGPWVNLTPVSRQRFAGIVLIQTHPDRRDLPAFGTSKCIDPIQRDIPIYDRLFNCSLYILVPIIKLLIEKSFYGKVSLEGDHKDKGRPLCGRGLTVGAKTPLRCCAGIKR